jgi:hyperosmotically inducible periplasmic protein
MKMKPLYPLTLLAAMGTLLATGVCLRASGMDDRIESSVGNTHVFKTYLKDDAIKIKSIDGAVTLTGTVAETSHKSLAQDTVEGLPGVKSVDNELTVNGESPAEYSDGWLSLKVKTALLFHRNVSAIGTEVSVEDGTVILRGKASSVAQKKLTGEYARDIEGVKAVRNEMMLTTTPMKPEQSIGEKIDDASITAQIKISLFTHRSTSALKTGIETTNGVVTVSGIAGNIAEKSLVTRLVTDIDGVNSVINNMTIAVPVADYPSGGLLRPPVLLDQSTSTKAN